MQSVFYLKFVIIKKKQSAFRKGGLLCKFIKWDILNNQNVYCCNDVFHSN